MPVCKTRHIMGTHAAGGRRPQGFRSLSQGFYPAFIKLGEYVGGHNISTKFYNQALLNYGPWIVQKLT